MSIAEEKDMLTLDDIMGQPVSTVATLQGGDISDVTHVRAQDGQEYVVKKAKDGKPDFTKTEAMMLTYLAENTRLPVPKVYSSTHGYLVMDYIPHAGKLDPVKAAYDVAEHIARLHKTSPLAPMPLFGFEEDTILAHMPLENGWVPDWAGFFADKRLNVIKERAAASGNLPPDMAARIDKLLGSMGSILPKSTRASLLHGDLWSGNILLDGSKVAAFIDPSIYYGHREVDIAFMELMGGMGKHFSGTYETLAPLNRGFWKSRIHLYQLWPLLVHVHLFGGGYVTATDQSLQKLGF